MVEDEAYALLRQWAEQHGLDPASVGEDGWIAGSSELSVGESLVTVGVA